MPVVPRFFVPPHAEPPVSGYNLPSGLEPGFERFADE